MNHWQLQETENTHKKFKGTQKALASADAPSRVSVSGSVDCLATGTGLNHTHLVLERIEVA